MGAPDTLQYQIEERWAELVEKRRVMGPSIGERCPYKKRESALQSFGRPYERFFSDQVIAVERGAMARRGLGEEYERMALRFDAGDIPVEQIVDFGEACFSDGSVAHAEKCFMLAVERDPGNSNALNNLGVIAFQQGQFEQAERLCFLAFEQSLDKPYWHAEAKNNLLAMYTRQPHLLYTDTDSYVYCPCCRGTFPTFLPFAIPSMFNELCPECNSLPRHRMLWSYMKERLNLERLHGARLLHFAPEGVLRQHFAALPEIEYVTVDLYMHDVTYRMDITDLQFEDDSLDAIVCVHVLEHIVDDAKAMRELYRVLRPGGWAILQSPLDPLRAQTYEDESVVSPEDRFRYFGQHDHVRIYGTDYGDRLRRAGFKLTVDPYCRSLPGELVRRCAMDPNEDIYLCRKG